MTGPKLSLCCISHLQYRVKRTVSFMNSESIDNGLLSPACRGRFSLHPVVPLGAHQETYKADLNP